MSQEYPKISAPEVLFVAKDFAEPETTDIAETVRNRGFISNFLQRENDDVSGVCGSLESHQAIDSDTAITQFIQKLESDGKILVTDQSCPTEVEQNKIPGFLVDEFYEGMITKIKRLSEESPSDNTIFDTLDYIVKIDIIVRDEEIMQITIFTK
jgi:hypothetical protein